MEKKLNQMHVGIIRRTAQNVMGNYEKVMKLNEKIAALTEERNTLQSMIDEMETPVMRLTGGYKSTDIFEKVIVPQFNEDNTPKLNAQGTQVKATKYILKYPDTIIPVTVADDVVTECGDGEGCVDSTNVDTNTEVTTEEPNNNDFANPNSPFFGM